MVYQLVFATLPKAAVDASTRDREPTTLLQTCSVMRYEVSEAFRKEVGMQINESFDLSEKHFQKGDSLFAQFEVQGGSGGSAEALMEHSEESLRLSNVRGVMLDLRKRCWKRADFRRENRWRKR